MKSRPLERAGVVITVRGGDSPVHRQAESQPDGGFAISPLYDGDYELEAEEGPLILLARKWEVTQVRIDPFRFTISQGRDLLRDLQVRVEQ